MRKSQDELPTLSPAQALAFAYVPLYWAQVPWYAEKMRIKDPTLFALRNLKVIKLKRLKLRKNKSGRTWQWCVA